MPETHRAVGEEVANQIVAAEREWLDEQPPTSEGTQNFITAILPLLGQAVKELRGQADALQAERIDARFR